MVSIASGITVAHQPVMDMAPRWEDGFGFQVRHESYGSDELLSGNDDIDNPLGLERHVKKTWLEGVYTFDRSKRITFKLPYVEQRRTTLLAGQPVKQENSGWGDLIVALPLKKYTNQGALTYNWGLTPQVRLPTGSTSGAFAISDGSVDAGLSLSYSAETFKRYSLYDLFYWKNTKGKNDMQSGDQLGLDINWGIHPYHNNDTNAGMFLMWDITARKNNRPSSNNTTTASANTRLHSGPVLVLYNENIMFRAEYKVSVYEKVGGVGDIGLKKGDIFQIGIGASF